MFNSLFGYVNNLLGIKRVDKMLSDSGYGEFKQIFIKVHHKINLCVNLLVGDWFLTYVLYRSVILKGTLN